MRSVVYCYGQKSDSDWNQLYKMYQTVILPTEKLELLKSLSCTSNKSNLEELLNKSINGTIRPQHGQIIFKSILQRNIDVPLDFFVENHSKIAEKYPKRDLGDLFLDLARMVNTNDQLKKVQLFKSIRVYIYFNLKIFITAGRIKG